MSEPIRILFVASADSPHAQSWMALLEGSGFDVRLFSAPLLREPPHTLAWRVPTYVTIPPRRPRMSADVTSLLPSVPHTRSLAEWMDGRFSLSVRWLRHVIKTWRPHIIHSMPLDVGGKLARLALEPIAPADRPRWVASAWGSDLFIGLLSPETRPNIDGILAGCDGFMADCRRDLALAESAGLAASKRALPDAAPGNGGVNVERFAEWRHDSQRRDVILVPKAFEREHANRTFTVIEAFRLLGDELNNFEIHLLMTSQGVRNYLAQMPEPLRNRCQCHGTLPRDQYFALLRRTRAVVAPSLSDGTPNVMLEAMAAGALPVVSPIESVGEWIDDGVNGLLAHAMYPDQIAAAVRRAINDDELLDRAARENWEIIRRRADRKQVATQVTDYYRRLAGSEPKS
jgi:glycosyltransferase involved in cell wall biosynthesis